MSLTASGSFPFLLENVGLKMGKGPALPSPAMALDRMVSDFGYRLGVEAEQLKFTELAARDRRQT